MRRILALAAVSSLALTGLIGTPAAADSTIQVDPDVVVNEVGIDLTESGQANINYVELINTTMTTGLNIDGWSTMSCNADGNVIGTTVIASPDPTTIDIFRLAGDNNYSNVSPNIFPNLDYLLDGPNGGGLDNLGGVALFDDVSTDSLHAVTFDPDNEAVETCLQIGVSTTFEASPSPTTSQTAQRVSGSWGLDDPDPQSGQ